MKSFLFTISLVFFHHFLLSAQFVEDFSGPNLNSQIDWRGDADLFRLTDGQLQLFHPNTTGSNTTLLYARAATSLTNFTTWRFWVQLDFSPSASNFARVYLGTDTNDLEAANGYYLQIGGISGSDDALVLYRQDGNGNREALLSGRTGAVGSDPAVANVQITRTTEGLWTLEADYDGGTNFEMEDAAMDATYDQLTYFGFYCQYTSTRSERFFFDQIFIDPLFEDTTPPKLDTIFAVDRRSIQVRFNEPVGPSALAADGYQISNGIGQPITVSPILGQDNSILLSLGVLLQNLQTYTLTVNSIEDQSGNTAENLSGKFSVLIPETPASGDLLLTEVLFNPQSGGEDFIEVYNPSNKVLDLNGLVIRNTQKISGKTEDDIDESTLLLPGQYLAITDDIADIQMRYPLPDTARFFENDLPTLDANAGNVSLFFNDQLLQSFDYSKDLHNPLLDNERGVSLERLSLLLSENDPQNWVSATNATGFATPGYANSQTAQNQIREGNIFQLERTTFSPDGDSFEDILLLNYHTESPGYIANIQVFDAQGRPIRYLSRNEALASRGLITWDGTTQEGTKARTGIYVLWIELFNPDGDKQVEKLTCVLASRK